MGKGLPWWLCDKESTCNVGDWHWIPQEDRLSPRTPPPQRRTWHLSRDDKNICARQTGNWMNERASVMQPFALNPGGPRPLSQGPVPIHTAEGRVVTLHLYLQPLPIAHVTA